MGLLGIHVVPHPLVYVCIPCQNSTGMKTLKRQVGAGTNRHDASNITESSLTFNFLPPATKLGQGNILSVSRILFTGGGGGV